MLSRKTAVTVALVALLTAVVAAEIGLLGQARKRAAKALAKLEQTKQSRDWLVRQNPAPSAENVARIAAEVAESRGRLQALQRELTFSGVAEDSGLSAERPTDGFFALQKLGDDLRRQAREARVSLRPDEAFGFASHAQEGPRVESLPTVLRQEAAVRRLVGALLDTHPVSLHAVRREAPLERERPTGMAVGAADFFVPPPGWLARQPGLIESDALRLEFAGQTAVLRDFMQRLAAVERAVLVRAVEVEPVVATNMAHAEAQAASVARFTVVLELPRRMEKPAATP